MVQFLGQLAIDESKGGLVMHTLQRHVMQGVIFDPVGKSRINRMILEGDEVVVHGPDAKTVYNDALARGLDSPFMHFVSAPDPDPLFSGWQGTE